tara:strand:- start:38 stop:940 length:903 start_codon:yes stop_codon:yes gene_type:complete
MFKSRRGGSTRGGGGNGGNGGGDASTEESRAREQLQKAMKRKGRELRRLLLRRSKSPSALQLAAVAEHRPFLEASFDSLHLPWAELRAMLVESVAAQGHAPQDAPTDADGEWSGVVCPWTPERVELLLVLKREALSDERKDALVRRLGCGGDEWARMELDLLRFAVTAEREAQVAAKAKAKAKVKVKERGHPTAAAAAAADGGGGSVCAGEDVAARGQRSRGARLSTRRLVNAGALQMDDLDDGGTAQQLQTDATVQLVVPDGGVQQLRLVLECADRLARTVASETAVKRWLIVQATLIT